MNNSQLEMRQPINDLLIDIPKLFDTIVFDISYEVIAFKVVVFKVAENIKIIF